MLCGLGQLLTGMWEFPRGNSFAGAVNVTKAGSVLGVITAFITYYIGLNELLAAEDMTVIRLPLGIFPKPVA
ncbi:hypothetical protein EST38_g14673 [Candolleomyces aberdarensis]|uniref:Uncharacterized protein n=1 Tax=Candolleomyces aberdarensis TaxID=2316362 RepID=A0A4Q2CXU8_9AGAR|nr:hypothetical protein EST38_g14673 [Candolleomyces aberdarensis]